MQTEMLIIGGGLSGLSLASELQGRGEDYLLVEGRDRLGGRIVSAASSADATASGRYDLGPSWIWPGQPRIANLAKRFGLTAYPQHSRGTLVLEEADGQVRRDLNYATMAGAYRIDGGIAAVTENLANTLPPERLLLSHRVVKITRQAAGYRVNLDTPAGSRKISAKRVVLALPPRLAAEKIRFEPPLPANASQTLAAIPTWMAGHAKVVVVYGNPFWREQGLSGDGISRRGPLMEIHDATLAESGVGALFGFVGLAPGSIGRKEAALRESVVEQLVRMYGAQAANPQEVMIKDWAEDGFTATTADLAAGQHPHYGMPPAVTALADHGLLFASTEMSRDYGGLIEGALDASEQALARLISAEMIA